MWTKTGLLWTILLLGSCFGTDPEKTLEKLPTTTSVSVTTTPQPATTSKTDLTTTTAPTASTTLPTTTTLPSPTISKATTTVQTTTLQTTTESKEQTSSPDTTAATTTNTADKQTPTTTPPPTPAPATVRTEATVPITTKHTPPPASTGVSSTVKTVEHASTPTVSQHTTLYEQKSTPQTSGSTLGSPSSTVLPSTEAHTRHISSTATTTKEPTTQVGTSPKPALTTAPVAPETLKPSDFNKEISWEDIQDSANSANHYVQICRDILQKLKTAGNCSLAGVTAKGDTFTSVSLTVDPSVAQQIYNKINEKDNPTPLPKTLTAILSSCGALVLILVCFALYCMYHHRSYRKNQQHLTEELQTVENGYHDNPTLEVMEVQPEMQEKKLTLNGEFNDSWIVPIDNLAKEEIPDEEDTHL